jgi:hypothetical protein
MYLRHCYEVFQERQNSFCPLIMGAGRPQKADPGSVYAFAHQFYWDFRRLAEGTRRWRFDGKKFEQLMEDLDGVQLIDDADRERHQRIVDEEIRAGRLEPTRRDERIRHIEDSERIVRRMSYEQEASSEAQKEMKVPGEEDVISVLLDPDTTPEQIRQLCKEAVMTRKFMGRDIEVSAWPVQPGSPLPNYLSQYAEQVVAALHDPRFPRSDVSARPSTRLKQFWFLSRALAGALFGVTTRTAINLVGSLRPEETFKASRGAKPQRKRIRRKYKARS